MLVTYNTHLASALPPASALENCASYETTVAPFVPQLLAFPQKLVATLTDPVGLLNLYAETNPLVTGTAFSLLLGAVVLVSSEINRNYSQIDRLWSLLPTMYIGHLIAWAKVTGLPHERVTLMGVGSLFWSCRLTYNYWRRGGYQIGSEDYRWAIVQRNMPAWAFFILNVTFISFMQSVLLMLLSLPPAYTLLLANQYERGITLSDWAHFGIQVAMVVSEFVSDGQQWKYQTAKHQYQKDGKVPQGHAKADLDRGFATSGLWAYSRHPNFAAEQTIWVVVYQWGCFAANALYSWTGVGAAFLLVLFQSSTLLTEAITAGKYPEYSVYQKAVGKFLPSSFTPYKETSVARQHQATKKEQ